MGSLQRPHNSRSNAMNITLPEELLQLAQMSEAEMMREIAIMLFEQGRISLGKGAQLAGMHKMDFQSLLASRDICVHYDLEDYQADVERLKAKGWL
jgi:predicted HTH domain antitoxin